MAGPANRWNTTVAQKLRQEIRYRFGRQLAFATQCNELSLHIASSIHKNISPQTLRRVLGFIHDQTTPSETTLHYLANYCGFSSMQALIDSGIGNSSYNPHIDDRALLIEQFYTIELSGDYDFNYQKACGNIARIILADEELQMRLSGFLCRSKQAQIYFFERHPYIDGLSGNYRKLIQQYIQEKKNPEAQLFSYSLLHLGSFLANRIREADSLFEKVNNIEANKSIHPFVQARVAMTGLLQAFATQNKVQYTYWKEQMIAGEMRQPRDASLRAYFPFFQLIAAEAFNLTNDYDESLRMCEIADSDYRATSNSPIEEGYYTHLKLNRSIALAYTGKESEARILLKELKSKEFPFIMQKYCLIQQKLLELHLTNQDSLKKRPSLITEVKQLISETSFTFFLSKI